MSIMRKGLPGPTIYRFIYIQRDNQITTIAGRECWPEENFVLTTKATSPLVFHSLGEFRGGQGVEDIISSEPRSSGLGDPIADFFHVRGVMRIGVNDDLHAVLLGHPQMDVAKIKPVGIGVEFHRNFVLGGSFKDSVNIERIRIAAQKKASRRMTDQRSVGIRDRFDQPICHRAAILVEL
jgi:hypothetical protein